MFLFAVKTLMADPGKLLVAVLGVVFSLVLVNIQGGMFLGMIRKTTVIVDNTDADIWVGHRGVENMDQPAEIPENWINRIRGIPGVERAEPYLIALCTMQIRGGDYEYVIVIGSDPETMMGTGWTFAEGEVADLKAPDAISVDELDGWRIGDPAVGDVLEINGKRAKIVAKTNGILGFVSTPYVFCRIDSARKYARVPEGYCSFFLVEAKDGVDLSKLCEQIRSRVPELDVHSAEDFSHKSRIYWILRTGMGMSFGSTTLLGLAVGLAMVAQSLYAFVLEHQSEYATLKAMGAEDRQVYVVLIVQGLAIATIGATVGTLCSYLIRSLISSPNLTIETPIWLVLAAVALAYLVCLGSAVLPFVRVRRVDPITAMQA